MAKELHADDFASASSDDLPHEILSNARLVHTILLTDPADFDKLSWDGSIIARIPDINPEDFISSFRSPTSEQGDESHGSIGNVSMRLAQSMKMAFFSQISQSMSEGNFGPVKSLMKELYDRMRALLPNRKDLHSHISDNDISSISSTSDIMELLLRSAHLLANYLESPARAPSTREMIDCLETFQKRAEGNNDDDVVIPYQVQSEHLFIVASIAFVLQKVELCQMDISNYKLSQAAPLVHRVGHEYERKHFRKTYGEYDAVSIEALQTMLPTTWHWIKESLRLFGNEQVIARSNVEQKMDFVKSRGFVDGMLFSRSQLSLPEIFAFDVDGIQHIRNEARCCVIASALVLHACNVSKVSSSVLSLDFVSDEVNVAKEALSSVLRKKHFSQESIETSVLESIGNLTKGKLVMASNFID